MKDANERREVSRASGAGSVGPRERRAPGVWGRSRQTNEEPV